MSKQVRLNKTTYEALAKWKSPGQSFDGAVKELLMLQEIEIPGEVEIP